MNSPELFASNQTVNKNYPLLTDGQYLYVIGKRFVVERGESRERTVPKVDQVTRSNARKLMSELRK